MAAKPVETVKVHEDTVSCSGGRESLGHPRVYLRLNAQGEAECPYCGKLFVREEKKAS
jgi:uncharacterized Zn-finger protein